jgi:lactoylglutathione lyase
VAHETDATLPRPFRVLGIQQIALGGLERSRLEHLWMALFGVAKVGEFESEKENVRESILRLGEGDSAVEIDLMDPIDADASPKVHQPALNHIGLWVDDLEAAVGWLGEQGVRFAPGGIRIGASGHPVTFIHPKGNEAFPYGGLGVLIVLVQAPPSLRTSS